MIENNGAAGVKQVRFGQRHHTGRRGAHNGTGGHSHVHTVMRTAGLTVVHPLAAVYTGNTSLNRPAEARQHTGQQVRAAQLSSLGRTHQFTFARNTRQLLRRRRYRALGHTFHPLDIVFPRGNGQFLPAVTHLQHRVGRGVTAEAGDERAVIQHVQLGTV